MASDIRLKLLQLVLDNPEIKRDAIRAHKEFEDEEDRTLANLLYNAKKDGQVVCDEGLRYTITAKGREYLKPGSSAPAAGKKCGRREPAIPQRGPGRRGGKVHRLADWPPPPPEAHDNGAARGIADKLLHQAQGALDEYVASVCDPEILGRFQAARDSARDVVESLNGTGGRKGEKHE